jgi:hypothetical protein
MRILRLLNRNDIATLGRGIALDIVCSCGEHHTLQSEHAYKALKASRNGDGAEAPAEAESNGKKRRQYTDAFKRKVARRIAKGESATAVATAFHIHRSQAAAWAKQLAAEK